LMVVIVSATAFALYSYSSSASPAGVRLVVSTTTSLYETGFLDELKTKFELKHAGLNVSFISQGTGLAIQTAMRGDADMILVHDPTREYQFLEGGYGVNRKIVAYNFFAIVGPLEDPAGISGRSVSDALTQIRSAGLNGTAVWISRGDDSGTHAKEKNLWKALGHDVKQLRSENWYLEVGSGMTATLKTADQKRGYTLTDVGTYLLNFNNRNIDLVRLVESGKSLLNVYSAIVDNPSKANTTKSNFEGSMKLVRYLVSSEGQDLFASFGAAKYGQPLFKPYLRLLESQSDSDIIGWIRDSAFFEGSECPQRFRYQADELYSVQTIMSVLVMLSLTIVDGRDVTFGSNH